MKAVLLFVCLVFSPGWATEKVAKRGITFGYGTYDHHHFDSDHFSTHGLPLRFVSSWKSEPPKYSFEVDHKLPLGGPFELGDYIHLSKYHHTYAPSYKIHYEKKLDIPQATSHHQFSASPQTAQVDEVQSVVPFSIDLPKIDIPQPKAFPQGNSEPVKTITTYSQQANSDYGAPSGQDNLVFSGFLNVDTKEFNPPQFGNGYQVTDENADKVPQAPPNPPIQRPPPAPVSIAKAVVAAPPQSRLGPVTFTPQSIGSGGLGVTQLPSGGFAIGSGSYGYAQGQGQAQGQAQGQPQQQAPTLGFQLPDLKGGFQPIGQSQDLGQNLVFPPFQGFAPTFDKSILQIQDFKS